MKRGIFLSFVVLFMAMLTAVMIVSKPDEQDFVNWLSAEDHEHTFTCLLPDCSKLSLVLPGDGGSGSMEFVLKKSLYDPGIFRIRVEREYQSYNGNNRFVVSAKGFLGKIYADAKLFNNP